VVGEVAGGRYQNEEEHQSDRKLELTVFPARLNQSGKFSKGLSYIEDVGSRANLVPSYHCKHSMQFRSTLISNTSHPRAFKRTWLRASYKLSDGNQDDDHSDS
jgi:hypothetical protein